MVSTQCYQCPSQESNPEPTDPKSGALSIELLRRAVIIPSEYKSVKEFVSLKGKSAEYNPFSRGA